MDKEQLARFITEVLLPTTQVRTYDGKTLHVWGWDIKEQELVKKLQLPQNNDLWQLVYQVILSDTLKTMEKDRQRKTKLLDELRKSQRRDGKKRIEALESEISEAQTLIKLIIDQVEY